jgi:glycine cleavage system H protein
VSRRYSKDHVWIEKNGEDYRVGLSSYARSELGEIVFVERAHPGAHIAANEPVCAVDSLKSTSDIYAPVSGTIIGANDLVAEENARVVNEDPLGKGWLFSMTIDNASELDSLMDEAAYTDFVR